jgi:hypothetical protein
MEREILEKQVREAVMTHALSKEALQEFAYQSGTGLIHPCVLQGVVNMMLPLYDEIARLKSLLLLDEPAHK